MPELLTLAVATKATNTRYSGIGSLNSNPLSKVKLKVGGKVLPVHAMKACTALDGGQWSTSRPGRFTHGSQSTGSWLGPTAGAENLEKNLMPVRGFEPQTISTVGGIFAVCQVA